MIFNHGFHGFTRIKNFGRDLRGCLDGNSYTRAGMHAGASVDVGRRVWAPGLQIALSNEGERVSLTGLANEIAPDDKGWVRLAPYGESTKVRFVRTPKGVVREKYIQVLDKQSAEAMVSSFHSLRGKIRRFLIGVPIYKRHPDLSVYEPTTVTSLTNDKTDHGMFTDLAAREDGFFGRVALRASALKAIENEGLKWLSPFWAVDEIGKRGDATVVRPVVLISAGLTDSPNIQGGEALANQNEETHMKELIIGLLALANDAGEADINKALLAMRDKANRLGTVETDLATARTAIATEQTALANERTALANARTQFATERNERIATELDLALARGQITIAQRPDQLTALANEADFPAKVKELRAKPRVVKTQAVTLNDGNRKPVSGSQLALSKFRALANELRDKEGISTEVAYQRLQEREPALWEEANIPE